jgi:hypothetical protein
VSLLGKLKAARAELEMPEDPWLAPLQRVRGRVERNVSTILRQPSVEFKLGCLAFSAVD